MSQPLHQSPILSVTFADGVTASARDIYIRQTYLGLVVGRPDAAINRHLLNEIPRLAHHLFGPAPVFVIPADQQRRIPQPKAQRGPKLEVRLPEYELWARLEADTPNPTMDGSHLTLVWHQHGPHPFMAKEVFSKIQQTRWREVAADFQL